MTEKEILHRVLSIIGYSEDKEIFVNKFFLLIFSEAIAEMATRLSKEQQQQLNTELQNASEAEQKKVIAKYFSLAGFNDLLTKTTSEQFSDYLETIYPTLTEEKQTELTNFLTSLPNLKDNK